MRRGFTLTEILVVIVLIILLLGMAVPAFHLISGSRSIDGAENQIAAMIGRARADAIGLQKPYGVMFFMDPSSSSDGNPRHGRLLVAEVFAADYPDPAAAPFPTRDVYLDVASDTDFLALPSGVIACTLSDGGFPVTRDRYLSYNQTLGGSQSVVPVGGVILFGGDGQLINRTYGFATQTAAGANTPMADLLFQKGTAPAAFLEAGAVTYNPPGNAPSSSLGFVLCDRTQYEANAAPGSASGVDDDPLFQNTNVTGNEVTEEQWIDDNSTPLLVNRYNGTLIRAE